jgi:ABC-type bacteriocin/lantibiotic exporter with double-glycine peptidase domain
VTEALRAVVVAASMAVGATPGAVRLDVPVVRQAPERCGPAALEMVLAFYGADSTARAAANGAYDPVLRGTLITDLARVARQAGYGAEVETLDAERVAALLREGIPPILLYDRGIGPVVRKHFGVVVGWDPGRREITLLDGGAKPRRVARDDLVRRWEPAGRLGLIVRPLHP